MPLQATSGAASYDAFGGGAAAKVNYIEDFFQSYLRTGTGASATVTTGLDGSTKETLVWTKSRSAATNHKLTDNVRGVTKALSSNTTGAEATDSQGLTAFSATGYTIGTNTDYNNSGATYADWQWVAQPKFFDIVTWTGNGSSPRAISHSLGSTPGCIIVKAYSSGGAGENWTVYHRRLNGGTTPQNYGIYLNLTNAEFAESGFWSNTAPTSTQFTVGTNLNSSFGGGVTYIAYIFAHDAGGFGLTGTDNVISCGSFTTSSGAATVTLGYEPQYLLFKRSDSATEGAWYVIDNMRGWSYASVASLSPNTSSAEDPNAFVANPTATGFSFGTGTLTASGTYIYIAIRRGPMKVPTTGTSVYKSSLLAGNSSTQQITDLNFPPDLVMTKARDTSYGNRWTDRLRGFGRALRSDDVGAELDNTTSGVNPFNMNGYTVLSGNPYNQSGFNYVNHAMRRAPSFFDEVCYTGNNVSGRTITHNLAAVPELMIVKSRTSATRDWIVYDATNGATKYMNLNNNSASGAGSVWASTAPTSTVFTVSDSSSVNDPAQNYVAYLFATCAGVSKVGSYTGTAATLQIDCGFTGGARFVLIKRTDSTGDWYVWDTARGIVSGNDPYLLWNSDVAEVTSTDYIDTYSAGFEISSTAPAAINASGGSFIFLAIS